LADQVEEAEASAHASIDAARTLGQIERGFPDWRGDDEAWWLACFDATERELEEQKSAIASVFAKTRIWHRAVRRQLMTDYIKANAMLTVGHGLETVWR
jgi:hypothetical protein